LWPVGGGQVGGSMPENRLPVKMAAARGVSGRRGGRLLPWSEQATSRRAIRGASGGEVAGGPKFVRAPWSCHCRKWLERAARLWVVIGSSGGAAGGSPRFVRASVVMALPEEPEQAARPWAVSGPTVGGAGGGPRFVQYCRKFCIAGSRCGGFSERSNRAASDHAPSTVDRWGQRARNPFAGEDGSGPWCVWRPGWQVVAVARAGNEPPAGRSVAIWW